jgi:hypothetical protein
VIQIEEKQEEDQTGEDATIRGPDLCSNQKENLKTAVAKATCLEGGMQKLDASYNLERQETVVERNYTRGITRDLNGR